MARRFLTFMLGIITGILILVIAVGGTAYVVLTKEGGMATVQEKIEGSEINNTLHINLSEEQQAQSLLEYGQGLISAFSNLSSGKIGDLEDTLGITAISDLISDTIGLDAEIIRSSSLENLGETITNNLTLQVMTDKFGIELPDMPLFQDEEFLSKPVSTAFGSLDQETLDKIVEVVYDDEATADKPASSKLLQRLGKKTIKEASSDMDGIVKETEVADVMTITDDSSEVLKYFRDNNTTIDGIDQAIKDMKISNAITVNDDSSSVMKYLAEKKLDEIDGAIKEMKIADAVDIVTDEEVAAAKEDGKELTASSPVLQYFKRNGTTLDGINTAIKDMKVGDAITIDENSSSAMKYLQDKKLDEIDGAIKVMPVADAVEIVTDEEAAAAAKEGKTLTPSSPVLQYFKNSKTTLEGLNTAIEAMKISDAVKIVTDEEAAAAANEGITLTPSSPVLQYFKKKEARLNNLNDAIEAMTIGDAVKIDTNSSKVLQYLQKTKLTELDADIKKMTIGDAVAIDSNSSKVLQYLKNTTLDGLDKAINDMKIGDAVEIVLDSEATEEKPASSKVLQYLKDAKLTELDDKIKKMKISDAVAVNENSHAILQKISDLTLTELGDKNTLQSRINDVTIGEVVTVGDDSEPILVALKDTTLGGLNDKIKTLTVKDVFKDNDVGILSAVPEDTTLDKIAESLTNTFKGTGLYSMRAMGMFDYKLDYEDETTHDEYVKKANMHNATPQNLVNAMTSMVDAVDSGNISKIKEAMAKTNNVKIYLKESTTQLSSITPTKTVQEYTGTVTYTGGSAHYTYYLQKGGSTDNVKDIDSIVTKDTTSGYYVITPSIVKKLATVAGEVCYGVTFFVDDGIKIAITDTYSDGTKGNFDCLFGMDFACATTDSNALAFYTDSTGMINATSDGGYAYFRCNNIYVESSATDAKTWATCGKTAEDLFTVKTLYKNATDKANRTKTRNTLIEIVTDTTK